MATATRKADQQDAAPVAAPTMDIDANDISIPRMRIMNALSDLRKSKQFVEGDIVVGLASDDPDSEKVGDDKTAVRFYVISSSKHLEGKIMEGGREVFKRWDMGDPEAPVKARTAYEFTIVVPDYDTFMPVKFTFGGSNAKIARGMNNAFLRQQTKGPAHELAWDMTTKHNSANGHEWESAVVVAAKPDAKEMAIVSAIAESLAPGAQTKQLDAPDTESDAF